MLGDNRLGEMRLCFNVCQQIRRAMLLGCFLLLNAQFQFSHYYLL